MPASHPSSCFCHAQAWESAQRLASILVMLAFHLLLHAAPRFYLRHSTLLQVALRLLYYAFPLLRKPRGAWDRLGCISRERQQHAGARHARGLDACCTLRGHAGDATHVSTAPLHCRHPSCAEWSANSRIRGSVARRSPSGVGCEAACLLLLLPACLLLLLLLLLRNQLS